jgi:histidine phosphotransferase ChpT
VVKDEPMTQINLDALDLGALLCSRVCHDVISPVGAIVNGLEVLAEEKDESMREFAHDLIRKSATQASARLQFARLAFGAAGLTGYYRKRGYLKTGRPPDNHPAA